MGSASFALSFCFFLGWTAFLAGALGFALGLVALGAGHVPATLFPSLTALICGLFVLARDREPHSAESTTPA